MDWVVGANNCSCRAHDAQQIFRKLHHRKRPSNPRLAKKRTPPPNGSGVHGHFCLSFSLGGCFLGGGGGVFGLASGAAGRGACL